MLARSPPASRSKNGLKIVMRMNVSLDNYRLKPCPSLPEVIYFQRRPTRRKRVPMAEKDNVQFAELLSRAAACVTGK
jgi:hypothetical protein